jgi:DNA invertase Pin-like site-specific DNA recombinase
MKLSELLDASAFSVRRPQANPPQVVLNSPKPLRQWGLETSLWSAGSCVARSARDLLNIIIGELDGRGFVSLGDSWCDATSAMGRFMLTVMSVIAELERDLIRKRCAAGIARAKANGKRFGRPVVLDAGQRHKIAKRYANGETIAALAREYECGKATVWRYLSL